MIWWYIKLPLETIIIRCICVKREGGKDIDRAARQRIQCIYFYIYIRPFVYHIAAFIQIYWDAFPLFVSFTIYLSCQ